MINNLYETDYQLWLDQTKKLLLQKDLESLDIEHLIEELEELGKSEKKSLKSNFKILIAHLLKLKVQHDAPLEMKLSWYRSIDEHRLRVLDDLTTSPSLKSYLEEAIASAYPDAKRLAIKEGKRASFGVRVPLETEYPDSNPFLINQLLDVDFYESDR